MPSSTAFASFEPAPGPAAAKPVFFFGDRRGGLRAGEAFGRRVKEDGFPAVVVLLDGQPAPGLPFPRQLHWVITTGPASEKRLARVIDAVASRPHLEVGI